MQIHELTQPSQQQLDEVVGGLARMAGQAIARSGLGQAVGQAAGDIKQGFQQSGIGQTLSKAGDIERQAKVSGNIQNLANAAFKQWTNKTLQLLQASGGQPIDEKDYKNHLTDFVQKVMLGNKSIDTLDATSKPRIQKALDDVVAGRNDRQKLPTAFKELVTQATAARVEPSKAQTQGGIQAKIENMDPLQVTVNGTTYQTDQDAKGIYSPWVEFQTGKPAPATITTWLQKNLQKINPAQPNLQAIADQIAKLATTSGAQGRGTMTSQQAVSAVNQFLQQGISGAQQTALKTFLQQNAGTPAVQSTGNPVTDALLNQLGIQTR